MISDPEKARSHWQKTCTGSFRASQKIVVRREVVMLNESREFPL
jgi:hypothetical protein